MGHESYILPYTDMNILSDWVMKEYIEICNTKTLENTRILALPFSEIDGVILSKVELCINKSDIFLKIEVENFEFNNKTNYHPYNIIQLSSLQTKKTQFYCKENEKTCFNRITIDECVKKMVTLFSQLQFNVLDGRFITKQQMTDDVLPIKQLHLLTTLGKCKSSINECCICLEETKTNFMNKCKHNVCVRCISRMDSQINCPMCRCKINYDTDDSDGDY